MKRMRRKLKRGKFMANREQRELLRKSVVAWNQWRQEHPDIRPDLIYADLSYADLHNANLSCVDLSYATLSDAILHNVNLRGANLSDAILHKVVLQKTGFDTFQ